MSALFLLVCAVKNKVYVTYMHSHGFLHATAVPAGTAEARITYGNSVRHDPVRIQGQVR